jgi:hypothetical protein
MKVAFIGVCKDIAKNIPTLKQLKQDLSKDSQYVSFFIYENNSADQSSAILNEWSTQDPSVFVMSEKIPQQTLLEVCKAKTWDNKPCRMECIALARNKLVDWVRSHKLYAQLETIVMLDLDNPNPFPVDLFWKSLHKYEGQYDCLICNGGPEPGVQYDAYAFRDERFPFGPEVIGERFWDHNNLWSIQRAIPFTTELYPVTSAFNGCCIFTKQAFDYLEYKGSISPEVNRYYLKYKDELKKFKVETHFKGSLLGCYEFGTDGIWYHYNSGYDKAVICEHLHAYCKLREQGLDKIFVCPSFYWKW